MNNVLTPRERVLQALNHKEPDKIPIDFAASRVTGIHVMLYQDLLDRLGYFEIIPRIYDVPQMLALPEDDILRYFCTDVVQVPKLMPAPAIGYRIDEYTMHTLQNGRKVFFPNGYDPHVQQDGSIDLLNTQGEVFYRMSEGGYYFSRTLSVLADADSKADIDAFDYHEMIPGEQKWLRDRSIEQRKKPYAVLGQFGGNFLERGNRLFGMENFFIKMLTEKPLVTHFFEKVLEAAIEDFDIYLEAVGDRVDIIQLNDDLGSQNGPLISEELYVSMIKPFHTQLIQHIRAKSNMYVFLHSCGGIYPFIPHLIEAGVQILNPIQYAARDMETDRLKREFGKDLVFWGGGCDAQQVLMSGTAEQVKEETKRQIEILSKGGGFVFSQVHNFQPNTPLDNVLAMYEVIKDMRA